MKMEMVYANSYSTAMTLFNFRCAHNVLACFSGLKSAQLQTHLRRELLMITSSCLCSFAGGCAGCTCLKNRLLSALQLAQLCIYCHPAKSSMGADSNCRIACLVKDFGIQVQVLTFIPTAYGVIPMHLAHSMPSAMAIRQADV